MKKRNIIFTIFLLLSLAINTFIVFEGATNGNDSSSQSFGVTNWVLDVIGKIDPNSWMVLDRDAAHALIRKLIGHFALFGLSGIISTLMFVFINNPLKKKIQIVISNMMYGFYFALVSELVQHFTPGRYMSFVDVMIDFSGYVLFGGITFIIYLLIANHKAKKSNQ